MNAIFERTSVRQYTNKKADPKTIETILKAGCAAPSAVNKQPWELIVVTDPARLAELAKFSPYAVCVQDAAFAVVVCADTNRHFGDAYDVQDLSALSENMLIEAKDLGLGGVWLGGYPERTGSTGCAGISTCPIPSSRTGCFRLAIRLAIWNPNKNGIRPVSIGKHLKSKTGKSGASRLFLCLKCA